MTGRCAASRRPGICRRGGLCTRTPRLGAYEDEFCGGQRLFGLYRSLLPDVPPFHQSPDQSILYDVLAAICLRAYRGSLTPRQALEADRGRLP